MGDSLFMRDKMTAVTMLVHYHTLHYMT